jgi:hypothetical protein
LSQANDVVEPTLVRPSQQSVDAAEQTVFVVVSSFALRIETSVAPSDWQFVLALVIAVVRYCEASAV